MKLYVQVREAKSAAKKAFDAQCAQFDSIMDACDATMLHDADKQGVKGFTTPFGTTYVSESNKFSLADADAFYAFVKARGDLDFFERRVAAKHVEEWMEANGGTLPPGLNIFKQRVMRVRKGAGE